MPKPDEVKIEIDDKKLPAENSEVSVEFNEAGEPLKKEEPKKEGASSSDNFQKYQVEFDKKLNASFYNQRKIEEQLRQISERLNPPAQRAEPAAAPLDEWNEKVQKNWKGTVEELADARAERKYQEMRQKEEAQRKINLKEQEENDIREEGKRTVLERYPDLNDETSEKAQIYRQVVMDNKDYLSNPRGPILAMRDMEERLRAQGKFVDAPTKQYVEKEVVRQTRANASQPLTGTRSKSNVIVLSKEEKEFCDNHNLKYESYAKSKRMTSASQGVEA